MIEKCLTSEAPAEQARSPSRMENCDNVEEGSDSEHRSSRGLESEDSRRKDGKSTKVARKGKLRGPNRQTLIGRSKRKINKEMGKASIPAKRKSKEDKVMMQPPVSVMFGENTKDGELSRMLQAEEKRLGGGRGKRGDGGGKTKGGFERVHFSFFFLRFPIIVYPMEI